MGDQSKNALIGLFIIAAFAIIIYILLFLHPSMGDEGQILHVRFANVDKVSIGTRVLFAGHPVGEVVAIHEVPDARDSKYLFQDEVYIYELTLRIDTKVEVYTTDEISVRTSGLLGEKSVAIIPKPAKPGVHLVRVSDQILYAAAPASVEDTVKEFGSLATKAQKSLDKINDALDTLNKGRFWTNLSASASNVSDITGALNQPEEWSKIVHNVTKLTGGFSTLSDKVSESWGSINDSIKDINHMTAEGRDMVDKVARGEGTLGKFINDDSVYANLSGATAKLNRGEGSIGKLLAKDDFYLHLTSVMSKAETLMDDINHYGLLFQNDQGWQRLRARRSNLLQKLRCPQEFRNFFNDEVNEISTALSRVAAILQQTTDGCCGEQVFSDCEFIRVYADLLRRVVELEENIKMYDQQVIELRDQQCMPPFLFNCEPVVVPIECDCPYERPLDHICQ